MSMRISEAAHALLILGPILGPVLGLAACSRFSPSGGDAGGDTEAVGQPVSCALGGAEDFTPVCRLEQAGAGVFLVHHPDGAFRRLQRANGGAGIVTADGADRGESRHAGGLVELRVGDDRYRIPFTDGPEHFQVDRSRSTARKMRP